MNNGISQLDPTGYAWWGDFLSAAPNTALGLQLSVPLNCGLTSGSCSVPFYLQDSAAKGADYIAGGSGSAMIFGESNNNVIQAHGSIDIAYPTPPTTTSAADQSAS